MATYSNIGIKLITTGDESGTWGTSTNTNFSDVLDEAIAGAVTYNISSDADFTLTVSDGTSSDARHAVIKFTSTTLTATRTCTFAPNDLQKTWVVINATTGGQSLTFKQGSAGATVTVPNGESAIIYSDGGGASAGAITRVLDSFTNTKITTGSLSASGNITSGGTLQALSTVQSSSGADLSLNANGANRDVFLKVDGTTLMTVQGSTSNVGIATSSPATRLHVKGTAGGTDPAVVTGERVRIQSNDTTGRSTYMSLIAGTSANSGVLFGDQDAADIGQIRYLHTDNSMQFYTSSAERMRLDASGNLGIGTTSPANALEIARGAGVAGGVSLRGNGNSAAAEFFVGQGSGSDAFLYNRANATMIFGTNNATRMTLTAAGDLGIGTTSPASRLDVRNTGGTYDKGISIQTASAGNIGTIWTSLTDLNIGIAGAHKFTNFDGSATRMTLDSSGNLGLGVTPSGWDGTAPGLVFGTSAKGSLSYAGGATSLGDNFYRDSAGFKYVTTAAASVYQVSAGTHTWYTAASGTAGNAITFTQRMTLDASGNLGLGVTPKGWWSGMRAVEAAGSSGGVFASAAVNGHFVTNAYYDGTNWKRINGAAASYYNHTAGTHVWNIAATGTIDSNITWTQAMTLDANGDLGIGTTSVPSGGASTRNVSIHNSNSAGTYLKLSNGATGNTASDGFDLIMGTSSDVYLYNRENGPMIFGTNATERARITAGGNLLVGTTTDVSGLSGVISDVSGNVRAIPQSGSDKTTSYTLVKSDVGKFIGVGSGGSITVPDATFATGDVVSIFNNTTGNVTLTMTITTAYIGGTNTDKATITLATRGVATILFISGTVCVVNGNVS